MAFTQGLCEKVQTSLINILGSSAPEVHRTQVGYLQAVKSPQNTSGITTVPVDPGNGKFKQVRVTYIQRGTESDITDEESTGCATDLEKEPYEQIVQVTNYLGTKGPQRVKFFFRLLIGACENTFITLYYSRYSQAHAGIARCTFYNGSSGL